MVLRADAAAYPRARLQRLPALTRPPRPAALAGRRAGRRDRRPIRPPPRPAERARPRHRGDRVRRPPAHRAPARRRDRDPCARPRPGRRGRRASSPRRVPSSSVATSPGPTGSSEALSGVDVAYFLVHMIGEGDDYPAIERAAAARFARAASSAGVGRIDLPRRARRRGGIAPPRQPRRHRRGAHRARARR